MSAQISPCGNYRWTLGRQWGDGDTACWIMLNPSKADAEADDPTIRRCVSFSRNWGYGALTVVNLYPYRSPKPKECRTWADLKDHKPDTEIRDMLLANMAVVVREVSASSVAIAAWGAHSWCNEQAKTVLKQLEVSGSRAIYALGFTKSGAPTHPMARGKYRVPDNADLVYWRDIENP